MKKKTRQILVTKVDGTVESFSLVKLKNCLANAMRASGQDPNLAGPLAKAVALHLQNWPGRQPPSSHYIYRCVCSVLQQTGLSEVADELAAHRRVRSFRRARLRVVGPGESAERGERWRKGAIVETLENDGLRHAVARFVAGQVETQVFGLGYRVLSKAFLRELVRNEVLAWGLGDEAGAGGGKSPARPPVGASRREMEA